MKKYIIVYFISFIIIGLTIYNVLNLEVPEPDYQVLDHYSINNPGGYADWDIEAHYEDKYYSPVTEQLANDMLKENRKESTAMALPLAFIPCLIILIIRFIIRKKSSTK